MNRTTPTVMIIDPDQASNYILDFALSNQGHRVEVIVDPSHAYASVCRSLPDLVLLESRLNEVDGLQLLRWLKANPAVADIPVLVMSIQGREVDIHAARSAGATGYVLKPYTVQDVVERIARTLFTA